MSESSAIALSRATTLVQSLHALGIAPPKAVVDALALRDEIARYEPVEAPSLGDGLPLKPADIVKAIEEAADAAARRVAFDAAKREAVATLSRRVLVAVNVASDEILAAVAAIAAGAAERFTVAYRSLPKGWAESAALLRAGPEAAQALAVCYEVVPVLDQSREVWRSLRPRPAGIQKGVEHARCDDSLTAEKVAAAGDRGALGYWSAVLDIEGVEGLTWWPSVQAWRDYAASVPKVEIKFQRGEGSIGYSPKKVPTAA
jgi:hypothetical protein